MVTTDDRLGQYRLGELLARGGMGEIFSAHREDSPNDKLVLKIVRTMSANRGSIRMFLDEARVSTLVRHPNVVTVYEVGYDAGVYFMAMEQLSGINLADLIELANKRESEVPVSVILRIGLDVCDALRAVHDCRGDDGLPLELIHRDVSPGNLFMTSEGTVKLLDFGVAKSAVQVGQTEVGVIKGTAHYMSPEQASGRRLDARSDLFSFGAVLWELVTGVRLFARENLYASIAAICREATPPPERDGERLPGPLSRAITGALEKDVARRIASAWALRELLEEADADLGRVASRQAATDFLAQLGGTVWDQSTTTEITMQSLGRWAGAVRTALAPERRTDPAEDLNEPLFDGVTEIQGGWWREMRSRWVSLPQGRRYGIVAAATALVLAAAAGGVALGWRTQPPAPAPVAAPSVAAPPVAAPPGAEGAVDAKVKGKGGRLSLETVPNASVYLGSRLLGVTPFEGVEVPAGELNLRLINADADVDRRVNIRVPSGKAVRRKLQLR